MNDRQVSRRQVLLTSAGLLTMLAGCQASQNRELGFAPGGDSGGNGGGGPNDQSEGASGSGGASAGEGRR